MSMCLWMFVVYVTTWAVLARKVNRLMATFQDVKDTLSKVKSGVDGLEASIRDLKAQVAAGHVISQAELDELMADAKAVSDDIADTSDQ